MDPKVVGHFHEGMHGVIPLRDVQMRAHRAQDILIAHAALTDYGRFIQKLKNIREVFRIHEGDLKPGFGWHWRRWIALQEQGTLRDEYDRSVLTTEVLDDLRAQGIVKSAAAMLGSSR